MGTSRVAKPTLSGCNSELYIICSVEGLHNIKEETTPKNAQTNESVLFTLA